MKKFIWILCALCLLQSADARERRGPPPLCPIPKVDCCSKPKPCKPRYEEDSCKPRCETKSCKPAKKRCCPPVCYEKGYPTSSCCTPSAYVEPANIDLRCGADVFFSASFIYWQAIQGGMDLAIPGQTTAINPLAAVTMSAVGYPVLVQDFEFKPGFQVGFGWTGIRDGWTLFGEYSWVRGTTQTSQAATAPNVAQINGVAVGAVGVWVPTAWFPGIYGNNNATTTLSSTWDYSLDLVDVMMSRPSYIGTHFILEPTVGARAFWLTQDLNLTAVVLTASGTTAASTNRTAHYESKAWALGPQIGLKGKWHLGKGIRFFGDTAASLLYSRYTTLSQDVASPDANALPLRVSLDDYDTLRPTFDFSLGLGWGSYFCCRRFHWDLALSYDCKVFFEQNMMRYLADLTADNTAHPDGAASNLYLHGLTFKTSFEF